MKHALKSQRHDAVPLPVQAARFALSQQEQLPAEPLIPVAETEVKETPAAFPESENSIGPSDAEDVDAIKLALQKATETIAVRAAQLATKDAQLRAKDDKISSQRQLVCDLNNKLRNEGENGGTGRSTSSVPGPRVN